MRISDFILNHQTVDVSQRSCVPWHPPQTATTPVRLPGTEDFRSLRAKWVDVVVKRTRIHSLAWRKKFIQSRLVRCRPPTHIRSTHRSAHTRDVSFLRVIYLHTRLAIGDDNGEGIPLLSSIASPLREIAARLDVNAIESVLNHCRANISSVFLGTA